MQGDVRSVEPSFSLHWPCDPDLSPLFWLPERRGRHSAVCGACTVRALADVRRGRG
jgi:hypothetical protein